MNEKILNEGNKKTQCYTMSVRTLVIPFYLINFGSGSAKVHELNYGSGTTATAKSYGSSGSGSNTDPQHLK